MNNALSIIRQALEKANKPNMRYNVAHSMHVEELSGEPNDRTAYDVGSEIEYVGIDRN